MRLNFAQSNYSDQVSNILRQIQAQKADVTTCICVQVRGTNLQKIVKKIIRRMTVLVNRKMVSHFSMRDIVMPTRFLPTLN